MISKKDEQDEEHTKAIIKKSMELFERMPESVRINIICAGWYLNFIGKGSECQPMTDDEKKLMSDAVEELDAYVMSVRR